MEKIISNFERLTVTSHQSWRLKSLTSRLVVQKLYRIATNKPIKLVRVPYLPVVGQIHRWPMDNPHKRLDKLKEFPYHDAIMVHQRENILITNGSFSFIWVWSEECVSKPWEIFIWGNCLGCYDSSSLKGNYTMQIYAKHINKPFHKMNFRLQNILAI